MQCLLSGTARHLGPILYTAVHWQSQQLHTRQDVEHNLLHHPNSQQEVFMAQRRRVHDCLRGNVRGAEDLLQLPQLATACAATVPLQLWPL
jgi:hypothetical protein